MLNINYIFKLIKILIILLLLIHELMYELNNYNKVRIKTAICVIAKKENKYIKEFINHYIDLGINKIFLYDNNDIEEEKFDVILNNFIKQKQVQIINFRGLVRPQQLAFSQCYNNNKYKYDWFAFYDVDEYLYLYNNKNINKFLSLPKFKKCSSLLINWKFYGDNNNLYYESKPLKERFKKQFSFSKKNMRFIYYYAAAKSIIRGGLNITWEHFPHYLKNNIICRPNGEIIKNPLSSPKYSLAHIKHYATKSTEEFAEKLLKGAANSNNTLNKSFWIDNINNYYFLFNIKNKDKINLFEKKLNISLNYFNNNSQ
jgi:hypothetical protein